MMIWQVTIYGNFGRFQLKLSYSVPKFGCTNDPTLFMTWLTEHDAVHMFKDRASQMNKSSV